jgi:hypothetical protein
MIPLAEEIGDPILRLSLGSPVFAVQRKNPGTNLLK